VIVRFLRPPLLVTGLVPSGPPVLQCERAVAIFFFPPFSMRFGFFFSVSFPSALFRLYFFRAFIFPIVFFVAGLFLSLVSRPGRNAQGVIYLRQGHTGPPARIGRTPIE